MPKVFVSFLGAVPYAQTRYYLQKDRSDLSEPMYYVQEAILRSEQWEAGDRIWIFTTKDAEEKNYFARADKQGVPPWPEEGLKATLKRLKEERVIPHFDNVTIPNGYTTEEMWEVFTAIFDKLNLKDDLYLDVTSGFRSLPMLATTMANYARTIKEVNVRAIYYGMFEAGRHEKDTGKSKDIQAPVIDLNVFTELQDWTYAAQTFIKGGDPGFLADLTKDSQKEFSKGILDFSQAILTCRGYDLIYRKDLDYLNQMTSDLGSKTDLQVQLRPLLEKVKDKIAPFQRETISNGFAAVQWCIDHGMIQQGITFLQETLVSFVIEGVLSKGNINNPVYRFAAGGVLNGVKKPDKTISLQKENITILKLNEDEIKSNFDKMKAFIKRYSGIVRIYKELTGHNGIRNDINHCGFRDSPATPTDLKNSLESNFSKIREILNM